MSKEQTDLLPCPFCGGKATVEAGHPNGFFVHHLGSGVCGISEMYTYRSLTKADAIAAWNRRASPSPAGGVQAVRAADVALALRDAGLLSRDGTFAQGSVRDFVKAIRALSSQAQTTGGVEPDGWVLIKRGLFWRPNSQGYTSNLAEAGIYSDEESAARCVNPDVTRQRYAAALKSGAPDA